MLLLLFFCLSSSFPLPSSPNTSLIFCNSHNATLVPTDSCLELECECLLCKKNNLTFCINPEKFGKEFDCPLPENDRIKDCERGRHTGALVIGSAFAAICAIGCAVGFAFACRQFCIRRRNAIEIV